jgi:xanthine dehydrogenase accessory factor
MEVFIEPLQSREPFYIFGAGHVAAATAPALCALDFSVTVIDDRPEWSSEERFPTTTLRHDDPVNFATSLTTGPRTWLLIVTHDHQTDQHLLRALIAKPFAWLGMIGSRAKVARFRRRLAVAGVSEENLSRLSAPVGLDIGAETPAEIAVSIAAEVIRVRRQCDRPGLPLSGRDTAGPPRPTKSSQA